MPEYSFRKEMENIDRWIGELRMPREGTKSENTSKERLKVADKGNETA